jgi:Domain of unknown function (DUF4405)
LRRKTANTVVDLAALAAFVLLVATGLVLEVRLPPGSGSAEGGVGARASERPVALVLGLTRHDWGELHFWVAVALFAVLALHVVLHWAWFRSLLRRQGRPEGDPIRAVLGGLGLVCLLGAAAVPMLAPREVVPRGALTGDAAAPFAEVRGQTTLGEAAALGGVAPADLARALGLAPDTPPGTPLGRLTRDGGFTLDDVRRTLRRMAAGR